MSASRIPTFLPVAASASAKFGNQTITLTGIAKGSGMIAPDMATMLAYIATDASIAPACLQQMLEKVFIIEDQETRLRFLVPVIIMKQWRYLAF